MKREPVESTSEAGPSDKRPRVETNDMDTSTSTPTVDELTAATVEGSAADDPTPKADSGSAEGTPAEPNVDATPETGSKGKGKGRGRGRGRGRDQRARTDRNAEKAGGKRAWEGRPRRGTRDDDAQVEGEDVERGPRLPKRKVAMQIGFCGTGYNGMQIQKDAHTIENTLFDAMVKAGAVSKDNSDDPVNLQRAARTDAGVHAAGNVVSLKMITEPPDTPDLVARLNELLPPEIRVWKFARALNAFNSRFDNKAALLA
ncbi:hypothetical protein RhiJN_02412 [Ceratobasidium sp. AG-Ba]|nr:hypothetical protein RhiJN_02412 [Ceratobasidium sp. AG-Ba]QRW03335.1 hypothetical protein RhiLY_02334 [Ceratobasidium sp. AG-Ba]